MDFRDLIVLGQVLFDLCQLGSRGVVECGLDARVFVGIEAVQRVGDQVLATQANVSFLCRRARSVFSASDTRLFTVPTGMSRICEISAYGSLR